MIREHEGRLSRPWLKCQEFVLTGPAVSRQQPSVFPHGPLKQGETQHRTALQGSGQVRRLRGITLSPVQARSKSRGAVIDRELLITGLRAKRQAPATDPMGTACCRVETAVAAVTCGSWTLRHGCPANGRRGEVRLCEKKGQTRMRRQIGVSHQKAPQLP